MLDRSLPIAVRCGEESVPFASLVADMQTPTLEKLDASGHAIGIRRSRPATRALHGHRIRAAAAKWRPQRERKAAARQRPARVSCAGTRVMIALRRLRRSDDVVRPSPEGRCLLNVLSSEPLIIAAVIESADDVHIASASLAADHEGVRFIGARHRRRRGASRAILGGLRPPRRAVDLHRSGPGRRDLVGADERRGCDVERTRRGWSRTSSYQLDVPHGHRHLGSTAMVLAYPRARLTGE